MRNLSAIAVGLAIAWTAPARAGEEPLYQPAPAWVKVATLPAASSATPIVLMDDQRRIENGRTWAYSDRAVRIDNPQVLQGAGTIQANWIPDQGDLIIHKAAIIRNGQEIDVLKDGTRFDVLRRERQLEMRTINGMLTATLVVPGLRVGDIFRLTFSVTTTDKALGGRGQVSIPLPAKPTDIAFARAIVSWPEKEAVTWKAGLLGTVRPEVVDGYDTITLSLPLAKPADMPADAPLRYQLPQLLQVGNFADWRDVSRVMSPLFATKGTIDPKGPIAKQVSDIERANARPLERALAALRVVQDQISYLANGMNGGNYIPQTPADTWSKRYGDCKAKTVLLLAMLRQMNIQAEPLVVASKIGDALPNLLPMPGDFDHIIVHATIDGTDYWLDGTASGANLASMGDVPDFSHGLPLRPGGADLIALQQRPRQTFDTEVAIKIDERAGLDVPALFEAKWTLRGLTGATFRAMTSQGNKDQVDQVIDAYASDTLGLHLVIDSSSSFDAQANVATVRMSGILPAGWQWQRGRATRQLSLPSADFEFRPDRSRPAWRDIPVKLRGPESEKRELTLLLPADETPYALDGKSEFDQQVANTRLVRHASLSGNTFMVTDSVVWPGGELPVDQLAQAKADAARVGSLAMTLRAPADAQLRYRFASNTSRAELADLDKAYDQFVAKKPDDVGREYQRSLFRAATFDRKGAIADLGDVIAKEPSAENYTRRAHLLMETGDLDGALADANAAADLEPGFDSATLKASILAYQGKANDAIALLEQQPDSPDTMENLAMQLSDLEALAGHKEGGLAKIDEALQLRPDDSDLLNAKCYYRGSWKFQLEGLAAACTEALERSNWSPYVLDSRAMGYFRLGEYPAAKKDLDAALTANPDLTPSLYLRGLVREQMGDKAGKDDIREALARDPSLKYFYGRFGLSEQ